MNNREYANSFSFVKYSFMQEHKTDRLKSGSPTNYIILLISGSGELRTKENTIKLKRGEMAILPKDCPYRSLWRPDGGVVSWYSLAFEYMPLSKGTLALQKFPAEEHFFGLVEEIMQGVNCNTVGTLYLLLDYLLKNAKYITPSSTNKVREVYEAIHSDPMRKISDIAKEVGISESSLYSLFYTTFNATPNQVRQKALCKKSIDLLQTTDLPIEEISGMLGFSSSSYFRKVLKEHTGKTPREIRKDAEI